MTEIFACSQAREGLTEYLENALSSGRRQGVERHLRGCPACRGHLARIRSVAERRPRSRMPEAMKARLMSVFRNQDPA